MLEENTLFAHRYRLVKRLGQGAFSEVWKAEDTKAGSMVVALKIYAPDKGMDEDGVKMFSSEFTLVFNVSHKNLLTPSYYDDYNGSPYLVLPFCEQGSAQRRIGLMDEREMAKFLFDVSGALAFLHAQHPPIIHQDIKPDNVLIDASGTYRVTDFGISTNLRSTLRKSVGASRANDSAGTMAYMGPERFNKNRETVKASDVWSLGATAYELMCSDVPFGEFGGLSQKNGADMPEVAGDYTQSLKQLVLNCLAKDTWDRPTAAQVNEICSQYLRDGYWNLEKLGMAAAPKKEVADKPSRATQRKVDRGDDPEPVKPPQPDNVLPKLGLAKIGAAAAIVLAVLLTVFLFPNKEERMWKKTEKSDSYESYTAYLQAYPGGKHVNDAKYHLSEYYKTQLEYLEGEVPIAIRELENEWNRYDESVGSLNILWEETETILHHDEDYYRVGRCNNIRSIMEEAVEKKIKAGKEKEKTDALDIAAPAEGRNRLRSGLGHPYPCRGGLGAVGRHFKSGSLGGRGLNGLRSIRVRVSQAASPAQRG